MNPQWSAPAGRIHGGVGRVDITPPADAYHRNWGAALHEAAEGIHQPLYATALFVQTEAQSPPQVLLTLDLGWLRRREMRALLESVAERSGVAAENLVVTFSHTHAAINLDLERQDLPGGQHIAPYLAALPQQLNDAITQAKKAAQPLFLQAAAGRCDLAWQRDFWDNERGHYTCGPNPEQPADDTVLTLRASDESGQTAFSLVNYGCHPTTLAWENKLISPDYIGALRETVEEHSGAPCLFVLGACGELGPRDGFVGDTATAERNGRQLAYAALSALESLPPPATRMRYTGPLISGATLGIWRHEAHGEERQDAAPPCAFAQIDLSLAARPAPSRESLLEQRASWQQQLDQADDAAQKSQYRARIERLNRALRRLEERADADGNIRYAIRLWRFGRCVFVLLGGEPYSLLQSELRRRFADTAIFVGVLCNESHSYILPRQACGQGLYQDECATLAAGALEEIIETISTQLRDWKL